MKKIEEAKNILCLLGLPEQQQNEISCLTFLALAGIKENDNWDQSTKKSLTISKGIMTFIKDNYRKKYAPNTRETFRRQVLHQFVQARIVDYNPDNPDLPVNSPNAHYALADDALKVIKNYGKITWKKELKLFLKNIGKLKDRYEAARNLKKVPIVLSNGNTINLSVGKHNEVERAIIKEFAPRFVKDSKIIYIGDTENKDLYIDKAILQKLKISIDEHRKLPDVILFNEKKNVLFLIEAVTSHGPVSPKRFLDWKHCLKIANQRKYIFQHSLILKNLKDILITLRGKQRSGSLKYLII